MAGGWGRAAGWCAVASRHVRLVNGRISVAIARHVRKIETNCLRFCRTAGVTRRTRCYMASPANYGPRPKTLALVFLSVVLLSTGAIAQQAVDVGNSKKPAAAPSEPQSPAVTGILPNIELTLARLFRPGLRNASVNTYPTDQTIRPGGETNGIALGFPQAEDGQGPHRVAQLSPSQATSAAVSYQTSNPTELAQVELREPETVTNDIDLALGQRSVYSDLRSLEDRITEAQQPVANITSRYSTQSNNLDIYQGEISQDFFFSEGASRLGLVCSIYRMCQRPEMASLSMLQASTAAIALVTLQR